ncbi:MAG: hypothetical protein E5V21_11130 [Mesorhizobium sp.]|nr:MAG: hypothetical protein E5V21_11130 [Mesorhizobium sp.]
MATHHGLFRTGPDGQAELISPVQDFMGFTPDPSDPRSLYASGHPAGGGNLRFIASTDCRLIGSPCKSALRPFRPLR